MGLFSFPGKNQQDADDDLDVPVKPRRSRRSPTQDEEPIDPMLPEKQRARRRLIGATALVLAAIIGLPMIFDADPNKPLADDVETQIPDKTSSAPESAKPQPAPQSVTQKVVESPASGQPPVPPQLHSEVKTAPEPAKTVKPNTQASDKPTPDKTAEDKATDEQDKSGRLEEPPERIGYQGVLRENQHQGRRSFPCSRRAVCHARRSRENAVAGEEAGSER